MRIFPGEKLAKKRVKNFFSNTIFFYKECNNISVRIRSTFLAKTKGLLLHYFDLFIDSYFLETFQEFLKDFIKKV